jgi:hypothetical protein
MLLRFVTHTGRLLKAVDRCRLGCVEYTDEGVELALGVSEGALSATRLMLDRSATLNVSERLLDSVSDRLVGGVHHDRHPLRAAVDRGAAAVGGVLAAARTADRHRRTAAAAAEHAEAGEEFLRLRLAAALAVATLDATERLGVDERLVGVAVDKLAEAHRADVGGVLERLEHPVVAEADAVGVGVATCLRNGLAVGDHAERLAHDGSSLRVDLEDAVAAAAKPCGHMRLRSDTALNRADLVGAHALCRGAALVLANHAEHATAEPLAGGLAGHDAGVERQHLAARLLNAFDGFGLHLEAAEQAVEEAADEDLRFASLDQLDRLAEPVAALHLESAAAVDLLERLVDKLPAFAAAPLSDALALVLGTGAGTIAILVPALTDDCYCSHATNGSA